MQLSPFPVIDPVATGSNIARLRRERGFTVRDLQAFFGFEEPQAIYKWQQGKSLPSVDNLYALGALLQVPMETILVSSAPKHTKTVFEQQADACCSRVFRTGSFGYGKSPKRGNPFCARPFLTFLCGFSPEETTRGLAARRQHLLSFHLPAFRPNREMCVRQSRKRKSA